MQQGSCILCIPVGSPAAYRCALVQLSVGALQWTAVIKKTSSPFLVYGSSDWWLFWCECSDDSASFLMQIWSFASSQATHFCCQFERDVRPEMTLNGLNHLCAQGGSQVDNHLLLCYSGRSCFMWAVNFGLHFMSLSVSVKWSWSGFPPPLSSGGVLSPVDDQSWPPVWLDGSASLDAVFWASLCLMITSPVCFSLKASRQIFICFANSLSLSWLLYLLSSVLTLC